MAMLVSSKDLMVEDTQVKMTVNKVYGETSLANRMIVQYLK